MCCHLHPPQMVKCLHGGSTREGDGVFSSRITASDKFFLFLRTSTSATSPGTANAVNTTLPSTLLTPFPSLDIPSTTTLGSTTFSFFAIGGKDVERDGTQFVIFAPVKRR